MKRMKSGGGWAAICVHAAHGQPRRLVADCGRPCARKNACKTCALGMGGQAGGMRNEAGHWPEVCKKSLQAMVADMQKGLQPEFFQRYSHRRVADADAPRAGMVRPTDRRRFTPAPTIRITASSTGTRRLTRVADKLRDNAAGPELLLRQRPIVQRGRLSAATIRPSLRHQLRQQLLLLLPPGQRRRPGPIARHRHRHRHAGGRGEHRPVLPHRRQSRVEPSAADAHR